MVVLARRIRGYAAMAKASSDCQVEKGRLPCRQTRQALAGLVQRRNVRTLVVSE